MLQNIKKLFWVSRPVSWPNTAYPFGAAYLIAGGSFDSVFWIGFLFFLVPYNLLMYGINDVFDYESDIKNPRKGGIEGMREQRAFHPYIVRACIIISIPFVAWLLLHGTVLSNLTFGIVLFFVLAYSVPILRFKERPVIDSITSSLHFVGPMVYALSLTGFSVASLWYIFAFFLWGMASHAFGAVQDILPDRKAKISSIATIFGAHWTVHFSIILYTVAAMIIVLQGLPAAVIGFTGFLYVWNIFSYRTISDINSALTNRAWRRFIWLNLWSGFVITITLLISENVL